MKKSRVLRVGIGLALVLTLSTATASAGMKDVFCAAANAFDVPGKNALPDDIATISLSLLGLKAILSGGYAVDQMRWANAKSLYNDSQTAKKIEPLAQFVGALKAFLKAFVPYSKKLGELLGYGGPGKIGIEKQKDWLRLTGGARYMVEHSGVKSDETPYSKFFRGFLSVHDLWMGLAVEIEVIRLIGLGVCDKVKGWCGKKQDKTCALPRRRGLLERFAAFGARRARQSACAAGGLGALGAKHGGFLKNFSAAAQTVSSFIRKWANPLKSIAALIKKLLGPVLKPIKKAMEGLKKVVSPIDKAFKKLDSLLDKKICIVKGACFRLKQIPEKIKKYSKKVTKPVYKQIDKLIDPVVKPLLKGLKKFAGLDALEKVGAKIAEPFGKIGDLFAEITKIKNLNLTTFKSRLQAISAELDALK